MNIKTLDLHISRLLDIVDQYTFSYFHKSLPYHHKSHIPHFLSKLDAKFKSVDLSNLPDDYIILKLAIYFHDIWQFNHFNGQHLQTKLLTLKHSDIPIPHYPHSNSSLSNEEISANIFSSVCTSYLHNYNYDLTRFIAPVRDIIVHSSDPWFLNTDYSILMSNNLLELIQYEDNIFIEYSNSPLHIYLQKRIEFLQHFHNSHNSPLIPSLIDYIRNKTYNIAVFPGSFNPFHKGHFDVLSKAEAIFDKVIITQLQHHSKPTPSFDLHNFWPIANKQIISSDKNIFSIIHHIKRHSNANINVSIVRGVRNHNDALQELDYFHNLNLIAPANIVLIPTDSKISSSLVREVQRYTDYDHVFRKFLFPFD